MKNKLLIPIAIVVAGALIGGIILYNNYSKGQNQTEGPQFLSAQEAANKLLDFINENLLQGQATASLIEVSEENELYKVKFKVEEQEVEWRISRDGRFVFPQMIDLAEAAEPVEETGKEIGNFSVSSDEVCQEDGKPIIYFFGSQSCPHCVWEHPIVEEVAGKFGDNISFHNNMGTGDDEEIFNKYSTGGVPTLVLGCKYYRVGSGENAGEAEEIKNLTTLICQLTDNNPVEVCQK